MNEVIKNIIDEYIAKNGEESLRQKLELPSEKTLTIIANAGVHPYDALHTRGEVFIASQGTLDFSSQDTATKAIEAALVRVTRKLKEKRWNVVYLVPFGPAPLSLQIKSLVNKVLDIETIDVLHLGNGRHVDISISPRKIAAQV